MFQILGATNKADFKIIATLASQIWREYYVPIIGLKQVEYMLNKFQSVDSMMKQVGNGYSYYSLKLDDVIVGYLSFVVREESLFLSKIYVTKENRGMGFGKKTMNFAYEKAKELNLSTISLTVNKYNGNSISAYEKMGYEKIDSVVTNIGGGFVMDDFVMEKKIE